MNINLQSDAQMAQQVKFPNGGVVYYEEPEEALHYWYPSGVKTPLEEFHLGSFDRTIAVNETFELSGIPQGTSIWLRIYKLGEVGQAGTMRWTPKAKGAYFFTLKKPGYKPFKFIVSVGLGNPIRKSFDLELL